MKKQLALSLTKVAATVVYSLVKAKLETQKLSPRFSTRLEDAIEILCSYLLIQGITVDDIHPDFDSDNEDPVPGIAVETFDSREDKEYLIS